MIVVIPIELIIWGLLSFASAIAWLDKYATGRRIYGLVDSARVVRMHVFWGILIWIGSALVGFFGGVLGSLFMMTVVGSDWMSF